MIEEELMIEEDTDEQEQQVCSLFDGPHNPSAVFS
jgi:hypothetical protein